MRLPGIELEKGSERQERVLGDDEEGASGGPNKEQQREGVAIRKEWLWRWILDCFFSFFPFLFFDCPPMGNSNSTSNRVGYSQNATSSQTFGPNSPRSSPLRTKKKSLELPDLASLSLTTADHGLHRIHTPPKSASIPIPIQSTTVNQYKNENRPVNNLSAVDDDDLVTEQPSTHIPFPPNRGRQTGPPSYFRGNTARFQQQQQQQQQRVQELYNQSNVPVPPPSSPNPSLSRRRSSFVQEVVYSSIPSGLRSQGDGISIHATPTLVPVKIVWHGGGKSVVLARAGDDDWKGRQAMNRQSPTSSTYTTTVDLPPGTHHIRFIVDDQWRLAEDLPTAVDDQGSMANYVAVPISYSPPRSAAKVNRIIPGQSFWSASSADGDDSSASTSNLGHGHHSSKSLPVIHKHAAVWTAELPLELIEAAKEEEAYLAASAGHNYDSSPHRGGGGRDHRGERGATHISGFVPAPNIPPAPSLPRHLDKLILNTRVAAAPPPGVGGGGTNSALVASGGAVGSLGNGLSAGTGIGGASGRGGRKKRCSWTWNWSTATCSATFGGWRCT
ncbi:hypothetical protein BDN72DRAFT_340108 [Pluteus cervinus]|uniref:Uncharacterized protein n=1 Tax=Pluteus cervinus TaxID=181527 RepID=A0ACD3ABK0_9AGAR|nr:hypothetical protein BDN72DRAFT_340108 [Pluteus cervinus]